MRDVARLETERESCGGGEEHQDVQPVVDPSGHPGGGRLPGGEILDDDIGVARECVGHREHAGFEHRVAAPDSRIAVPEAFGMG